MWFVYYLWIMNLQSNKCKTSVHLTTQTSFCIFVMILFVQENFEQDTEILIQNFSS